MLTALTNRVTTASTIAFAGQHGNTSRHRGQRDVAEWRTDGADVTTGANRPAGRPANVGVRSVLVRPPLFGLTSFWDEPRCPRRLQT